MAAKRVLRIVVASPTDTSKERYALAKVIDQINLQVGTLLGLRLELSHWEMDTFPAFHIQGPQAHVESILRIEDCEILICIFARRFGTPTQSAKSGTESEFKHAYRSWKQAGKPQIMMYFLEGSFSPSSSNEIKQWKALKSFRAKFPREGLFSEYANAREFKELVRRHLMAFLSAQPRAIIYRAPLSSFGADSSTKSHKHYDSAKGEYRIRSMSPLRRPGSDLRLPLIDFDFEVLCRKIAGSNKSWYGVYIVQGRGTNQVQYHDFFVSGLGTYTYEIKTMDKKEKKNTKLVIIQKSRLLSGVKGGNSRNRIRLIRRGSIVEFYVNGTRLLELSTSLNRLEEVQVGIAVHAERNLPSGKYIDVAFSEWIFFQPE